MTCPSCGVRPVARLELVCDCCRAVISAPQPEPIQTIVPRVMTQIEQTRKDAA